MKKTIMKIFVAIVVIFCGSIFINAIRHVEADVSRYTNDDYRIYALRIPEKLDFAGEKVPLSNPDIRERIDKELLINTYWQSNGLLLFKRAAKYFPRIEPILKENGIPNDFKYLAAVESGLTNAVSPAGAKGVWQLMKTTAKENGLEVNNNVDERYHLQKATTVACRYFSKAKERFGSWTLAAAAYNAGIKRISKRLDQQQVNNYYDLLLNEETSRYVFRALALKEILNHPEKYGFIFTNSDLYKNPPTYKIQIDTAVSNLASLAKRFAINYKILKIHNPWLRENKLNNKSRKQYYIEIPENGYYTLSQNQQR